MPCRTCPGLLEKAERVVEEIRTYHARLVPADHDYDAVQAGLLSLAQAVRDELIRQGRYP